MTNTSRTKGAVGPERALVYRFVNDLVTDGDWVLDFGCGKDCSYVKDLVEKQGGKYTPYDLNEKYNDKSALDQRYDVVLCSNVLNVQKSREDVDRLIETLADVTTPFGILVFNYPSEPRHAGISEREIIERVLKHYKQVYHTYTKTAAYIYVASFIEGTEPNDKLHWLDTNERVFELQLSGRDGR